MSQKLRSTACSKASFIPNDWCDGGVVAVVHPGEKVVLDLVVEPPVQLAEPPTGHVGRGDNLHGLQIHV